MLPPLVDLHCHLDLYPNHGEMFSDCAARGIEVLAVTTTPRAWRKNQELATGRPSIRVGLGLHPQLIADGHDELALFERHLGEARYVGEVGLDAGPRFYKSFAVQRKIFERILCCCAEHGNKILSIHTVRSGREVLTLIEKYLPRDRGKAVLHWFNGSKSEAKWASELGCYFSINREMLKSESGRVLVASLPRQQLLTETDGPFTLTGNLPSQPWDVMQTVQLLSDNLRTTALQLRHDIRANLQALERGGD
jgi:TatD DNase family protein